MSQLQLQFRNSNNEGSNLQHLSEKWLTGCQSNKSILIYVDDKNRKIAECWRNMMLLSATYDNTVVSAWSGHLGGDIKLSALQIYPMCTL